MFSEIVLLFWSGGALVWWLLAWRLTVTADIKSRHGAVSSSLRTLSVFKPLPPLGPDGLKLVAAGLESFVAQLDSESELLLGIHEADRDLTGPFLKRLRKTHTGARIKVVYRSEPDEMANPKIAWQKILAREAEGELWLWSDADIVASPGFLQSARFEFARSNAAMITFPYVVREIKSPPALLEALFVNAEFYPGVLLLRALGPVDFGLGAGMLFQRDDFVREVDWNEIGAWLADDFFLGQRLQPVCIGTAGLATQPSSATWKDALLHDLRWTKTIRWNRPIGSFSRVLIMPVLGWIAAVVFHPSSVYAWFGLLGMVQAEVLFAIAICHRTGCRLTWGQLPAVEIWSFWRLILWFLCWLPTPVSWSERLWRGPRMEINHQVELRRA